jgi:hypothetical protein
MHILARAPPLSSLFEISFFEASDQRLEQQTGFPSNSYTFRFREEKAMSQTQIQVTDVRNNLYIVVEQSFEDRADMNEIEGTKWETPSPTYSLTDLQGNFLSKVERSDSRSFVNTATGETYSSVGT